MQVCPADGTSLVTANPLDPAVATALGSDYRILDWLGSGGMGAVYLAEQIRVGNRKVALKVLHRRFSEDEEFITRFENEAASTGRINQPNVITIYESKQAPDGTLYIAMELVEGDSLTEHLRQRGQLALVEVVDIVAQCCKALQAAHRLGIIHRDIKPDNIMLTRDSDGARLVKILDFGIAKLMDSGGHTVTGSVLGTPAYMSYEQASGLSSEKLDGRSDIYSLGLVTYAMLVGHPPFRSDTPVGYITKHLSEAPPSLRAERSDLPAAVEAVVLKSLEKDRERRYQTAVDFAAALREAAVSPAGAKPAPGPIEPAPTPPWRATRPTAGQSTEVSRPGIQEAPVATPAGDVRVPTLPSGATVTPTPAGSRSGPVPPAAVQAPPAGPPPTTPATTTPRLTTPPPRASGTPARRPAPEWDTGPVATPAAPRRPRPTTEGRRPSRPQGGGEGLAAALWGIRTLLSWGITAYALALLLVFAWPMVGPLLPPSVRPVVLIGQQVTQLFPSFSIAGFDPVPLVLAIALLLIRPRVTNPLWRLEARARARAVSTELPE
jgi:serine/threonine-protein kinase